MAETEAHGALVPVVAEPRDLVLVRDPEVELQDAQRAARALRNVIERKERPVRFNGEIYLEFEDWQMVGRFYGITAKVVSTAPVEFGDARGWEARAVALHAATGVEISAAESMCLNDEPNWRNKPLFQLRSQAQTRACSKVLRNVLSWVVVLAGYRPTPAEELEGVVGQPATVGQPAIADNGKPAGCQCAGKRHWSSNPNCPVNGGGQGRQTRPADSGNAQLPAQPSPVEEGSLLVPPGLQDYEPGAEG